MSFARDTMLIFRRQIKLSLRNPAWVIIGLIQPILYLAFFGPLLSRVAAGAVAGFPAGNSYSFFVPGLLIQLGLFGAAFVGFTIIADWRFGVIERLRVTPVSRLAILSGRVLRDVVTLVVHSWALLARMYLTDRWLVFVTNLYSSAVFIGWGSVILCLILEVIYRNGIGTVLAAVLGSISTGRPQIELETGSGNSCSQPLLEN